MPRDHLIRFLAGAALAAFTGSAGADPAPDSEKLTHLVIQECGSCHGLTLKGGLGTPLTAGHLEGLDRETITHIILTGIPGTPMPPWAPLMTEADADWIADMLKQGALE